jgi:uncharacterized protein (TIGR03083 family)
VRVYDLIVAERLRLADVLDGLTSEQFDELSLCDGWTIHDVAAHMLTYLRYGQLKIYLGILTTAADFDRLNQTLTRYEARRPHREIVAQLRRRATARTTIPFQGYDPVLTDLMLHDLDIRYPLGIPRHDDRGEQLWVACRHLAAYPAPGYAMGSRLAGLRLQPTDADWVLGDGLAVQGSAEMLLLGMGGREAGLHYLSGDGVPVLRERLAPRGKASPLRRLAGPARVLLHPPPPARRSRAALSD